MASILGAFLNTLKFFGRNADDDYIDRLHYFITSNVLVALSILVSFKQFGGKPIECLVPDMFSKAWEEICYYQWVPFFLLLEAAFFRLPNLCWQYLAGHSGIQIQDIVGIATDPGNVKPDTKAFNIKCLTTHLQNALRFHRRLNRKKVTPYRFFRILNLPYSACYVTFIYLFVKSLYLANVVLQMYLMNKFLETEGYTLYGFEALGDIIRGTEWDTSGIFPRVTLCDFKVRVMGNNVQRYSVQCILVINIFNEKIFIFLWFWFMILIVFTAGSLFYWLFTVVVPWSSRNFVSRHLELSDMPFDAKESKADVDRFVRGYLRSDGVFVLRMLTMHAGIIIGTDLVSALWRAFYGIEENLKRKSSDFPVLPSNRRHSRGSPTDDDGKHSAFSFLRLRLPKFHHNSNSGETDKDKTAKDLTEILIPSSDSSYVVRSGRKESIPDGTEVQRQVSSPSTSSSPDRPVYNVRFADNPTLPMNDRRN